VFLTASRVRHGPSVHGLGKAKSRVKDQGEVSMQKEGNSWLEAPWKLAPEAAAALAEPVTFENMSYVFIRVRPLMLVLCF
jgi:hypothetical protein